MGERTSWFEVRDRFAVSIGGGYLAKILNAEYFSTAKKNPLAVAHLFETREAAEKAANFFSKDFKIVTVQETIRRVIL